MNHTEGKPKVWCNTQYDDYEAQGGTWPNWNDFKTKLQAAFTKADGDVDAIVRLDNLRQSNFDSVNDYNVEFNALAKEAGMHTQTDKSTIRMYTKGLKKELALTIIRRDKIPGTLQEWQDAALKIDNAEQEWERIAKGVPSKSSNSSSRPARAPARDPDAMDVDAISREDARRSGLCFNCGGKGHLVKDCPSPKQPRPRDSQG